MSSNRIIDLRKGRPQPEREAPRRTQSREPERRTPLRLRRRKARFIIAFAILMVCAGIVYGVHVASYAPRLTISWVNVTGEKKIPPELISAYVNAQLDDGSYHFFSRRNIFFYPKKALANAVAVNFPRIDSASVARDSLLSTTLTVAIVERQPFASWCLLDDSGVPSHCYVLDEHGYIFADDEDGSEQLGSNYIFSGGIATSSTPVGETFAPGHLPGIVAMMKLLTNAEFTPLGASVQNDQDFFIQLQQGFYIKASYGEDAAQLVRNLQLVLASDPLQGKQTDLEYVDLRFGDRVYYKLKGQAESPVQ